MFPPKETRKHSKITLPMISTIFAIVILFDAIDFLVFESRSTLGALFTIIFIFPIVYNGIFIYGSFPAFVSLIMATILIFNNSVNLNFFKSLYFLAAVIISLSSANVSAVAKNIVVNLGSNTGRKLADNFIRLVFVALSLDSVTYYFGFRDFIVNPNQVGFWAALYFTFGFLANRVSLVHKISNINLLFALSTLLLSGSKGALFLMLVPTLAFSKLKFLRALPSIVATIYLVLVISIYGNISEIEVLGQVVVQFKQDFIGGSGEYSDYQRLVEIPLLVINSMTDYYDIFLGKGVAFTIEDGLYQQIIPHNSFFLLFSHVGLLGVLLFYISLVLSIYKSKYFSVSVFISVSLLFVSMTGSPQVSRGPTYPLTVILLASVLFALEFEKIERKNEFISTSWALEVA